MTPPSFLPMSSQTLDVYIAFCQRRGTDPAHWMLLVGTTGTNRCTWYHVTGGPTQNSGYTLMIQANKRIDSFGIVSRELVGTIQEKDLNKLKSSAQSIPLQRCQRWTCDLLEDLERKALIEKGQAASYRARIEPSPYER